MAILLSDLYGGAGGGAGVGPFIPTYFSGHLIVPAGASGTIITITPPAGKRAKLMSLGAAGGSDDYYYIGKTTVVGTVIEDTLGQNRTNVNTGAFTVGVTSISGGAEINAGMLYDGVLGEVDEVITVGRFDGVSARDIHYSFCYGDC